ncbi:Uncharacterised protein [Burkholderia pseudomallei]|nr:Uncharacterised protein [Burkholderia pseudomallei]
MGWACKTTRAFCELRPDGIAGRAEAVAIDMAETNALEIKARRWQYEIVPFRSQACTQTARMGAGVESPLGKEALTPVNQLAAH